MIEINLLPTKLKKAKQMQFVIFLVALGGMAVAAGLLFLAWTQVQQIAEIDREIKRIDAESASLTDKIAEVNRFDAMKAAYDKKKLILDKLMFDQAVWPRILDMVAETILPDMWVKKFSFDKAKEEGIVLVMEGSSPSRVIFADFLKRLEENSDVMELKAVSVNDNPNTSYVDFNISFTFKTKRDK